LLEAAKQIGRHPRDYTADVVVDGLTLEQPPEWGFYRREALIENDWDCEELTEDTGAKGGPPDYFRVDAAKEEPCVSASLVAVALRDKEGKVVASYLADGQYEPLLSATAEAPRAEKAPRAGARAPRAEAKAPRDESGRAVIDPLVRSLKDRSSAVRAGAAGSLGKMGAEAAPAAPALAESLSDPAAGVRSAAVSALAAVGPDAVPALVEALHSGSVAARHGATQALALHGPTGKDAVSALVEALKDRAPAVRRGAAYALGRIGPEAGEAVPALVELAKDRDPQLRALAATALQSTQSRRPPRGR
jgi:HEAT repeat protein